MSNRDFNTPELNTRELNTRELAEAIFDDPIAYLARCGIAAALVAETSMPAAA